MQQLNKEINLTPKECALVQIYYDCKTIRSLVNSIKNNWIACISLVPYMSLFCWETIEFFKKSGMNINIIENETFSLKDIRLKLKIFENQYSKAKNMILNCDYLQDYIFRNKLKFDFMKNRNMYYNLGIIFNSEKDIVGNSQFGYYIFQDNKLLKRRLDYVKSLIDTNNVKYDYMPEEYFEYGRYCGEIIRDILNCFESLNTIDTDVRTNKIDTTTYYKDFNSNKLYKSTEEKTIVLYLLHILSFVNSTIKMLGKCEIDDYG